VLREAQQFSLALDTNTECAQSLDQQFFMGVLRKDERERVWSHSFSGALQWNLCGSVATRPEIEILDLDSARDDGVIESNLVIELQGTRLHRERARSGTGLRSLVDEPNLDAESGQPEREDEAGGPGAGDQNLGRLHVSMRASLVVGVT